MALLERDGRRVRLTPAARGLVARTDRALAELDAAEAELAAEHQTVRGDVVIGAFPSAAARLVIPAIAELAARHPELTCVDARARAGGRHPPASLGRAGPARLRELRGRRPAPAGGLAAHLLLTEPLLLVHAGPEPADEPVPLASFRSAAWIGGLAGTQYAAAIEQACGAAGFTPRIVHRADEAQLIQALAAAGAGVGLLPALACSESAGVRYAAATPAPPARHVHALVRRGAAGRPALAAILDALLERAPRAR